MKKSSKLMAVLLVGTLGLTACDKVSSFMGAGSTSNYTTAQMVDAMVKQAKQMNPDFVLTDEIRKQMEDSIAQAAAVAAAAKKEGIDQSAESKMLLKMEQDRFWANEYFRVKLDAYKPTDDELKALFDKQLASFPEDQKKIMNEPFYHVRHILVPTEADAKKVADALAKGGTPFEELAKVASKDGSAQRGGDLGWAPLASYVPEFAKAAQSLQPKQVSAPVKTQFGYHIIEVMEAPKPAFEAVKPKLIDAAKAEYAKKLQDGFTVKKDAAPVGAPAASTTTPAAPAAPAEKK